MKHLTIGTVLGLTLALGCTAASADTVLRAPGMPVLAGCVSGGTHAGGLWTIPTGPGENFELINADVQDPSGGAYLDPSGRYVTVNVMTGWYTIVNIAQYNTETWELAASNAFYGDHFDLVATDMDWDPVDRRPYGCFHTADGKGYFWGYADYSVKDSEASTQIAPLTTLLSGVACTSDGQFYGIQETGELVKIDKATGALEVIGDTGLTPYNSCSAAIDPRTGRMFFSYSPQDGSGSLYEISLTDGSASQVASFADGEQVKGMYVGAPAAADKAPCAPTFTLTFDKGDLSGTASISTTNMLYDGTPAEEGATATYSLQAASGNDDPVELATGTIVLGQSADVPVTLTAEGAYRFTLTLTNEAGISPVAKASRFVGFGTPCQPGGVELTYAEGNTSLTWTPVDASCDGGYLEADKVTYNVVRYPDEQTVATGLTECAYSEQLADPATLTAYSYGVSAVYEGHVSEEGKSRPVYVGDIVPPYLDDFNDKSALDPYTIIDANGDEYKWAILENAANMRYSYDNDMDDWLITPPIKLEGGKSYLFQLDAYSSSARYTERMEVKFGTAPTVEGMTTPLIEAMDITQLKDDPHKLSAVIFAPEDGTYYIGLHGISDKGMNRLYVDNLSISAPLEGLVPATVTDLVITPDFEGANKATISFRAPQKNLSGEDLTELTGIVVTRDGEVIKTFETPEPGKSYEMVDETTEPAEHTYELTATNQYGTSPAVTLKQYVGLNIPGLATDITIAETQNDGEVTVTWTNPTVDAYGNPLNQSLCTWGVYKYITQEDGTPALKPMAKDLTEPTATFTAIPAGDPQDLVYYYVMGHNDAGYSSAVATDVIPVGKPEELPYANSFTEADRDAHLTYVLTEGDATWTVLTDADDDDGVIKAQDGDNAFLAVRTSRPGAVTEFATGKIYVPDQWYEGVKPVFTMQVYKMNGESNGTIVPNLNRVELVALQGTERTPLTSFTINDLEGDEGWKPIEVDLSDFRGQQLQLVLKVVPDVVAYTLFDNFKINDPRVSGINAVECDPNQGDYTLDGNSLSAHGPMTVFTLDGRLLLIKTKGDFQMRLTPGVYLLTTPKGVSKILVK